jgi:hypothetical protein
MYARLFFLLVAGCWLLSPSPVKHIACMTGNTQVL